MHLNQWSRSWEGSSSRLASPTSSPVYTAMNRSSLFDSRASPAQNTIISTEQPRGAVFRDSSNSHDTYLLEGYPKNRESYVFPPIPVGEDKMGGVSNGQAHNNLLHYPQAGSTTSTQYPTTTNYPPVWIPGHNHHVYTNSNAVEQRHIPVTQPSDHNPQNHGSPTGPNHIQEENIPPQLTIDQGQTKQGLDNIVMQQFQLTTVFGSDQVTHILLNTDKSRGRRRLKTTVTWYKEKMIGKGGFSEVWLEQDKSGKLRAVKVLAKLGRLDYKPELLAHALLKDQLLFVEYYGWFEDDDHVYLAMEYFKHGDLGAYIHSGVDIKEQEASYVTSQILEGLKFMFDKNITHCDLKPQNIFIHELNPIWVKLGDFGLVKRTLDRGDAGSESPIVAMTPNYAAPEICGFWPLDAPVKVKSEYTKPVDIWSMGIIAFELLTGTVPFTSANPRLLWEYCLGSYSFPRDKLENVARHSGVTFLERVLSPDPGDRPSLEECLEDPWILWGTMFGDQTTSDTNQLSLVTTRTVSPSNSPK